MRVEDPRDFGSGGHLRALKADRAEGCRIPGRLLDLPADHSQGFAGFNAVLLVPDQHKADHQKSVHL